MSVYDQLAGLCILGIAVVLIVLAVLAAFVQ